MGLRDRILRLLERGRAEADPDEYVEFAVGSFAGHLTAPRRVEVNADGSMRIDEPALR